MEVVKFSLNWPLITGDETIFPNTASLESQLSGMEKPLEHSRPITREKKRFDKCEVWENEPRQDFGYMRKWLRQACHKCPPPKTHHPIQDSTLLRGERERQTREGWA